MTVTAMPKNDEEAQPKKKPIRLIAFVLVLVIAAGAGWFLVLKPKEATGKPAAPKPGAVLKLDSLQINLTDGHYLRVGIALQFTDKVAAEAVTEIDGSKALDAEIATFSGLSMAQVMAKGARDSFKAQLLAQLKKRYEDEPVMDVYYTEFVTQ
ncbi:flagellar basal body-associated protein FliL [Nocardioides sp. Kera G14]|uniref:flagellar basal body-associated FliL family protein n=1 Tax=Nocardioides sp. Kera G14 TaxID=2884264 RepID=UPI001D105E40|nr:flagellar basal body-associated FliL family protein [Nocardioides sp. Kera G14]UDY24058.1 flagellar basal body-associated FliL family protein [Nocardioides sp. Kera G14]